MSELLEKTRKIVEDAITLITSNSFDVFEKNNDACNLVTSADIACQNFLTKELTALVPDSFVCGEESPKYEYKNGKAWIIDPIDGTANFSRGINLCAISVALVENGVPQIGIVHCLNGDVFYAEKDDGAYLNGNKIHVSDKAFNQGLFCTAMSLYKKELAPLCYNVIQDVYPLCSDVRRLGSCAVELCYLACGRCDLYFEIRVFPWDFCAGAFILQQAGGIVGTLNYQNVFYDGPQPIVAANNKDNYDKLQEITNKYIKEIPYNE